MMTRLSARLSVIVWLLAAALLAALVLYPVSNRLTRVAVLVLLFIVWRGLVAMAWPHRLLRFTVVGLTVLCIVFLLLPGRTLPPAGELRSDYTASLRRYEGVRYYWGGESFTGIDCSGLVRRGLIDSLFLRGLRTADSGLFRRALSLWWSDTSARALGGGHDGLTIPLFETQSLNVLDHSRLQPGDLAVTTNGIHIMVFLGGNEWIEADPGEDRVIRVTAPADNPWFSAAMHLVRWRILSGD